MCRIDAGPLEAVWDSVNPRNKFLGDVKLKKKRIHFIQTTIHNDWFIGWKTGNILSDRVLSEKSSLTKMAVVWKLRAIGAVEGEDESGLRIIQDVSRVIDLLIRAFRERRLKLFCFIHLWHPSVHPWLSILHERTRSRVTSIQSRAFGSLLHEVVVGISSAVIWLLAPVPRSSLLLVYTLWPPLYPLALTTWSHFKDRFLCKNLFYADRQRGKRAEMIRKTIAIWDSSDFIITNWA